jgi:integrase
VPCCLDGYLSEKESVSHKEQTDAKTNEPARDNDAVLPWPHNSYDNLYTDWHAIQTAAGIPEDRHYVPKNCRSSCASALIAANVPTVVVKELLGHATVATTENYYINAKPALRAATDARKVWVENQDPPAGDAASDGDREEKNGPSEKL